MNWRNKNVFLSYSSFAVVITDVGEKENKTTKDDNSISKSILLKGN